MSPLGRLFAFIADDPAWIVLALLCCVVYGAIFYMRPKWRAMDEAGHLDADRKRAQLKGTRKL